MIVKYKPQRNLLETILHVEILKGMALTLKRMFSKPITRQYPTEKQEPFLGFRGMHALTRDPETGESKCVACMRCVTVCPSRCIKLKFHTDEQSGARVLDTYDIEALRCIYCGYCEEVCPVGAVVLTELYEYCSYDRKSVYFTKEILLDNWDTFIAEKQYDAATYVNPFWRPRGMPESMLPEANRRQVPDEWTIAGQPVGRKFQTDQMIVSSDRGGDR